VDEARKFRPAYAPEGWQKYADEGRSFSVESDEAAEARERAWREFAQPGAKVPLLWDDGVTLLEIASVAEDGTIEVRAARPD
jgi:hypothetical protein